MGNTVSIIVGIVVGNIGNSYRCHDIDIYSIILIVLAKALSIYILYQWMHKVYGKCLLQNIFNQQQILSCCFVIVLSFVIV